MKGAWYDSGVDTAVIIFGRMPLITFSIMIGVGVGVGLLWSVWPAASHPGMARLRLDAGSLSLAGALVGGRSGIILLNWHYYQENIGEIPQVWLGGFAWSGALIGALIGAAGAAQIYRSPVGEVADGLLPLFTSVTVSAWLASWMTGHAYGAAVDSWWGVPALDEWGEITLRWPTQLAGAFSVLGVHWSVEQLRARRKISTPGLGASLELAGLGITLLALSPFRADPGMRWNALRMDQWFSFGVLFLSILFMALFCYGRAVKLRTETRQPDNYEN